VRVLTTPLPSAPTPPLSVPPTLPLALSNLYQSSNFSANACYPDGNRWKLYEGRCYFFSGTSSSPDDPPAATWWDAEHWCKTNGGHLASIHDENTNAFLAGQVGELKWRPTVEGDPEVTKYYFSI
jgi:hypothetical protein